MNNIIILQMADQPYLDANPSIVEYLADTKKKVESIKVDDLEVHYEFMMLEDMNNSNDPMIRNIMNGRFKNYGDIPNALSADAIRYWELNRHENMLYIDSDVVITNLNLFVELLRFMISKGKLCVTSTCLGFEVLPNNGMIFSPKGNTDCLKMRNKLLEWCCPKYPDNLTNKEAAQNIWGENIYKGLDLDMIILDSSVSLPINREINGDKWLASNISNVTCTAHIHRSMGPRKSLNEVLKYFDDKEFPIYSINKPRSL